MDDRYDMDDMFCSFMVGETVPDFKIETYDPDKGKFGSFSIAAQKKRKRWTVLFFYPADFTFV